MQDDCTTFITEKRNQLLLDYKGLLESQLNLSGVLQANNLRASFYVGATTAESLIKEKMFDFDSRLRNRALSEYSVTLVVRSQDGKVKGVNTIFVFSKREMMDIHFWYQTEQGSLKKVSSVKVLNKTEELFVTIAFTEVEDNFQGKNRLILLYPKALRTFVATCEVPVYIECTGEFALSKELLAYDSYDLPEDERKSIGVPHKNATAVGKFAQFIGLEKTRFYHLRTIGPVYTSVVENSMNTEMVH